DLVDTTVFGWQEHDLRSAAVTGALEGQDSPSSTGRSRDNVMNVLEIIHESVDVSYTKQATARQLGDIDSAHPFIMSAGGSNPVVDEMAWQIEVRLKEIKRDIEFTIINGTFNEPANNSTKRQTRGLLAAITTNVSDVAVNSTALDGGSSSDDVLAEAAHGLTDGDKIQFTALTGGAGLVINMTYFVVTATTGTFQLAATSGGAAIDFTTDISAATYEEVTDLTQTHVLGLMQDVWDNGGIGEQETAVIIANSWNKRQLTEEFLGVTTAGFRQDERTVGGVNLQTFDTDFGRINVMLNRYIPQNTVAVASIDELRLKWLERADGAFVIEQIGRVGAKVEEQFYGEWGLMYGNERSHGELSGLSTR
ncbi:hypothetical protein LCGC14_2961180, partial [marine sediment metagenome]